ncbi:MAG: hypothetical protein FWG62_09800 [Proteobacteria bacterium]|nr:hypothetical protein [Pseudomonadota bacterium]
MITFYDAIAVSIMFIFSYIALLLLIDICLNGLNSGTKLNVLSDETTQNNESIQNEETIYKPEFRQFDAWYDGKYENYSSNYQYDCYPEYQHDCYPEYQCECYQEEQCQSEQEFPSLLELIKQRLIVAIQEYDGEDEDSERRRKEHSDMMLSLALGNAGLPNEHGF